MCRVAGSGRCTFWRGAPTGKVTFNTGTTVGYEDLPVCGLLSDNSTFKKVAESKSTHSEQGWQNKDIGKRFLQL